MDEALALSQNEDAPVRHHRVPVSLLRNWSDADDRVRCFDLKNRKSFISTPSRILREKNYYRLEDAVIGGDRAAPPLLYELALSQIESKAAPALRRWLGAPEDLTQSDFSSIAMLLTAQYVRGERSRNAYREVVASTYRDTADVNDPNPEFAWFARELKEERFRIGVSETELTARMFDNFWTWMEFLVSRQWVLFESQTRIPIGDEPIVLVGGPEFDRGQGVGIQNAGVVLAPMSPNRLVGMFRPDVAQRLGFAEWGWPAIGTLSREEGLQVAREICMAQERWIVEHPSMSLATQFPIPNVPAIRHLSEEAPAVAEERGAASATRYFKRTRWADQSVHGVEWPVRQWWRP